MNKNYLILAGIGVCCLIIILLLGGALLFAAKKSSLKQISETEKTGITTGEIARDFSLTTIEGKNLKLSDFRGKYVLFAFMATWCIPCQIEAENVRKVQENKDFIVIQISIDARETDQDLIKFRKEFGRDDWIMGFDKNFEIAKLYKVRSFDTTLVVGPQGKIIYRDEGWPIETKILEDLIQ